MSVQTQRKPQWVEITYMPDHRLYKFKKYKCDAWNEENAKAFYESEGYMSMIVSVEDCCLPATKKNTTRKKATK